MQARECQSFQDAGICTFSNFFFPTFFFVFLSGKVKLGFHRESGFKVAIKIIAKNTLQSRPAMQQKLEREIAIMKFLDHPNVLRLYDVYDTPNYLFLVLEHVEGGELFDYLLSKKVLPEQEALRFFQQLVEGVEYCLADDHQILTSEGFLGMQELESRWNGSAFLDGLKVAAFDEVSQQMQFEEASRLVLNKWKEQELIEFPSLGLRVTPEHDMYVEIGGVWAKVTAGSLLQRGEADSTACCRVRLTAPMGVANDDSGSWRSQIGLSSPEEGNSYLQAYGRWLAGDLAQGDDSNFCPLFPDWVWSLGKDESLVLLSAMREYPRKRSREDASGFTVSTGSATLRDQVSRLALQCGVSAVATQCGESAWKITCHESEVVQVRLGELRRSPYAGQTWCVTVPSGKIFARGKVGSNIAIVGNCHNHLICHRGKVEKEG